MELSIKLRKFLGMAMKEQLPFPLLTVVCKDRMGPPGRMEGVAASQPVLGGAE